MEMLPVRTCVLGPTVQEGAVLFSGVPGDGTGGNGHMLKYRKFCLYIRKKCLKVMVIELWAVEFLLLEMLKTQLNVVALSKLI